MQFDIGPAILAIEEGDITNQECEAIVNAANIELRGGGGVDGAIHRAGGPAIMEECRKIGGCPTGQARITTGGRLKAKFVIHTVGPIYRDGNHGEPAFLASAYRSCLELASEKRIKTVSFPSISTGVYAFPIIEASRVALDTVHAYMTTHPQIKEVRFVLHGKEAYEIYLSAAKKVVVS